MAFDRHYTMDDLLSRPGRKVNGRKIGPDGLFHDYDFGTKQFVRAKAPEAPKVPQAVPPPEKPKVRDWMAEANAAEKTVSEQWDASKKRYAAQGPASQRLESPGVTGAGSAKTVTDKDMDSSYEAFSAYNPLQASQKEDMEVLASVGKGLAGSYKDMKAIDPKTGRVDDGLVAKENEAIGSTKDFLEASRARREGNRAFLDDARKTNEDNDKWVKDFAKVHGLTLDAEETKGDMFGGRSSVRADIGGGRSSVRADIGGGTPIPSPEAPTEAPPAGYVGDPFNDPIGGYDEREIGIIAPRQGNSPELAAQFPALGVGQMLGWTGEDTEEVMNIPEGAYIVGNRVMTNNRRQRSILNDLSEQAKDAYDAIQFKSVEENGRLMDKDAAKVRAMWQVGDISRERAFAMTQGLRELRASNGKPMKLGERTGETTDVPVFDPKSYGKGGGLLDPVEEVIADLPKGSFLKSDGKYYRKAPVTRDNLSLTTRAETDAYGRIQKDFAAVNGRDMDRDVAAIRARLDAGTITKTQAKDLAVALRRKRDIALAKETSHDYHVSHGLSSKESDLGEDWTKFFVDTGEAGQLVKRDGKRRLLSAMNQSVSSHGEGSDEAKRSMTLARRFGFGSRHEFTPEYEVTPEANLPANYEYNKVLSHLGFHPGGYWAAARRNAESVIADVNNRERNRQPLSSNDRRSRANAVDALLNHPHIRNADSNDFSGFKLGTDPKRFKRMNKRFAGFTMPEDK